MNKAFLVCVMAILMCMGLASAATTFSTPGASAVLYDATYAVNITTTVANIENCSFIATSTLTSDSLATTWAYNDSTNDGGVNVTIDTTALEDGSDWIFTGTCYNGTNATEDVHTITSRTGVTVDNTIPAAATSLAPTTSSDENNVGTWSASVTDARTTACTLFVTTTQGTNSYAMTYSGTSCTYASYLTLPAQNSPTFIVEASDGLNETNSSSQAITVDKGGSGAASWYKQQIEVGTLTDDGEGSKKAFFFVLLFVVLVYGYYTGWFTKKKRR